MEEIDVVTVVANSATTAAATAHMHALEQRARRHAFVRDAKVMHWTSEDVPNGYMRIFWGDAATFVEAKVLPPAETAWIRPDARVRTAVRPA